MFDELFIQNRFLLRDAFNQDKKQVSQKSGIYAWYFTNIPEIVPTQDCYKIDDKVLLYIGISPSRQSSNNNLRKRLSQHFNGNGASSTLRKSLGCLLGFQLIGDKNKKFYKEDEQKLSLWMSQNAFVKFVEVNEPWLYEKDLIKSKSLPLNLEYNQEHRFYKELKKMRCR